MKTLEEFVDWLPELEEHEAYFLILFARKKYGAERDAALGREVVSDKDTFIDKCSILLNNMSVKGAYLNHCGLYFTPNPRDLKKAQFKTAKEILKLIEQGSDRSPVHVAKDAVQTSKSKSRFVHFEIDEKPLPDHIAHTVKSMHGKVVETRGGYHLLFPVEDFDNAKGGYLYKDEAVDRRGDLLMPVVGTLQGGHGVEMK